MEGVASHPELDSHDVLKENLGVLLPVDHPLAKRKEVSLRDLKDETIILHSRKEAEEFHDRIVHLMKGLNKKAKIYIKNDEESCPILVAMGKGVSLTIAGSGNFVPEHTRFVPIKDMFLPVRVFWRRADEDSALKTFISFILESKSVLSRSTHCLYLVNE